MEVVAAIRATEHARRRLVTRLIRPPPLPLFPPRTAVAMTLLIGDNLMQLLLRFEI